MKYSGPQADPTSGARMGYTRVSTVAQTLDQQNEAVAAAGVTKTFSARKVADAEPIATARRMKVVGHTARDIAKSLGVSRATHSRYLEKNRAA